MKLNPQVKITSVEGINPFLGQEETALDYSEWKALCGLVDVKKPIFPVMTPYPTFAIIWLRGHKITLVVAAKFGEVVLYVKIDKAAMVDLLRKAKGRGARFETYHTDAHLHVHVFE